MPNPLGPLNAASVEDAIQKAIKEYIASETEKAVAEVKDRLDAEVPKILAEIGIKVQSYLSQMDNEAVIQIRLRR